jgi:hypothetical protein
LRFDNARLKEALTDYRVPTTTIGTSQPNLLVSVFAPTRAHMAQFQTNEKHSRERRFYDLWYALGDFGHRTVEPILGTELYRVRPLPDGPTWMIVTRRPDPTRRDAHLARDFWIGGCSAIDEGRLNSCSTQLERGGLFLTIHTTEANLPLRDSLANYVMDSLSRWKTACDGVGG